MAKLSILIVEDEVGIAESLAYMLKRESFLPRIASSLADAQRAVADDKPALLLLDLMLPDGNGLDWLRALRTGGDRVPVIVLTSRDALIDRVVGLELGADDYVTKPFSPREVVARIKAVLRRVGDAVPAQTEAHAALHLDRGRRTAHWGSVLLPLSKLEFDLAAALSTRPGQVLSRDSLLDRVWGDGVVVEDRTVDAHVKSLRRKIADAGGDADVIETVRGVGYRMRE